MALVDDRPLRADARRNRAAIVRAARAVFARHGRDAQMDDVARRAKVGVGTLYRHFPTKEALLAALAEDRFRQLAGIATETLEIADPWEALATFMHRGTELHANDRALGELLVGEPGMMRDAAMATEGLQPAIEQLVTRAQAAGAVRADARWEDIPMAFCALCHVEGPPRASWQRLLALVLDGLRAPAGAPALPD
jgi:AcrR family transcriptional regulator